MGFWDLFMDFYLPGIMSFLFGWTLVLLFHMQPQFVVLSSILLQGAQAKFVHFEFSRYFRNFYSFVDFLLISKISFGILCEIAQKFKDYVFACAPCTSSACYSIPNFLNFLFHFWWFSGVFLYIFFTNFTKYFFFEKTSLFNKLYIKIIMCTIMFSSGVFPKPGKMY